MSQASLPLDLPASGEVVVAPPPRPEEARLRRPVRNQAQMMVRDLDSLVAEDHPASDPQMLPFVRLSDSLRKAELIGPTP